jgi:hypothetical protein
MGFSIISQVLVIGVDDNGEHCAGKVVTPFSEASHDCCEFSVMDSIVLFCFIESLGIVTDGT